MIDKTKAKKLVMRLAGLPGFPRQVESIAELVCALAETTRTEAQAAAVVESFSQHSDRCPLPIDIRRQATNAREEQISRQRGCPACRGTGYLTVFALHTQERGRVLKEWLTEAQYDALVLQCPLPRGQLLYTGAHPCVCNGGKPIPVRVQSQIPESYPE